MTELNLDSGYYGKTLKTLLAKWNDGSGVIRPLVIVKVSEAFIMYHQIMREDYLVENRRFKGLHPVLINDLETNFSVILSLDTAGRIVHADLISSDGHLRADDRLLKFAHKNASQEYLDYFYCISQNIQQYLEDGAE